MLLFRLKKGGEENGRGYYEECGKEREGLYVLCGRERKSLPRKDGPWRKEKEKEKEKIIVSGTGEKVVLNRVGIS